MYEPSLRDSLKHYNKRDLIYRICHERNSKFWIPIKIFYLWGKFPDPRVWLLNNQFSHLGIHFSSCSGSFIDAIGIPDEWTDDLISGREHTGTYYLNETSEIIEYSGAHCKLWNSHVNSYFAGRLNGSQL